MHGNRHFFFFPLLLIAFFFFLTFWKVLSSSFITGDHREMLKIKKVRSRMYRYFDLSIFAPSFTLSHFSCVRLWDPMDCSPPGSLCMGFPRQEYWSGLSCHHQGIFPTPGIRPESLLSPTLAGVLFTTSATLFWSWNKVKSVITLKI